MHTGDLIYRRTEQNPLYAHYGVVVVNDDGSIDVVHRQRSNGGVIQPLDMFLKGYPIRGTFASPSTGATAQQLRHRFNGTSAGTFHILFNNCEDYAYRFAGYDPVVSDTEASMFIALILVAVVYLIANRP